LAEVIDLAWAQDGLVKTVSLEVPLLESKRVLHAFQSAESIGQQQQACDLIDIAVSQQ
jgi:hypothetical protein